MKFRFAIAFFTAIAAIGLALGVSAFKHKKADNAQPLTTYFFRYTLTTYGEANIKEISNYERSDLSCTPGDHVCGVYLATDKSPGQQPVTSEFDAVKDNLWASEFASSAQLPSISMRE